MFCNIAENNTFKDEVSVWKSVNPDSCTMHKYSRVPTMWSRTGVCYACVDVELIICIPGPAFSRSCIISPAFSSTVYWSLKLDIIGPAFPGPSFSGPAFSAPALCVIFKLHAKFEGSLFRKKFHPDLIETFSN